MTAPSVRDLPTTSRPHTPPARSWPRRLFRCLTTLATVLLFDQAVFAGQFLSGTYPALLTHRENATYAGICVALAGVGAVLLRWPGRGPWWPIAACTVLFGLIALQMVLGFSRVLTVHIPLGVTIIMLSTGLTAWAWRGQDRPVEGGARR